MHPDKDHTAGSTERFISLQEEKARYEARLDTQDKAPMWSTWERHSSEGSRTAKERADREAAKAAQFAREQAYRAAAKAARIAKARAAAEAARTAKERVDWAEAVRLAQEHEAAEAARIAQEHEAAEAARIAQEHAAAEAARIAQEHAARAHHFRTLRTNHKNRRTDWQFRTQQIHVKNITRWTKHEAASRTACLEEEHAVRAARYAKEHADQVGTPDAVRNAKELADRAAHATEAARLAKEHADQARAHVSAHMAKEWTDQANTTEHTNQAVDEAINEHPDQTPHVVEKKAGSNNHACFITSFVFEIAETFSEYMVMVCYLSLLVSVVLVM
jgi:hypothetical protein